MFLRTGKWASFLLLIRSRLPLAVTSLRAYVLQQNTHVSRRSQGARSTLQCTFGAARQVSVGSLGSKTVPGRPRHQWRRAQFMRLAQVWRCWSLRMPADYGNTPCIRSGIGEQGGLTAAAGTGTALPLWMMTGCAFSQEIE